MFKDKGNHLTSIIFYASDHEAGLHYSDMFSCHFYMRMCCCF
jgi:hypothetical protein